ncbi:2-amino-4-hydroxy-6-hydroxymethyldihydropteridine diphosphokinase [Parachlamydia sp. AcF125]|uniref:2-amino-4-hydroxy-6- hydroxymethyldihydropteridine diphosphokinase n=1 Tax=Parachlamydia sp. AcF125 TaxID=2795736 RepID=UPI001BC8F047|nr:2-amino-4-hydroxy-6- hydroxymethyldihydropteridine pyrophosphokinase [Parachlamydia sp. AcF125]
MKKAFVGLGGNIGDSCSILRQALKHIEQLSGIVHLKVSSFYLTTPVGPVLQNHFVNAVCCFETTYSAEDLLAHLQGIEKALGKVEKPKNAPRIIDLDLLFFGTEVYTSSCLQVPHPRWRERLFVLAPLADLVEELEVPLKDGKGIRVNLRHLLHAFPNIHEETVSLLQEKIAI